MAGTMRTERARTTRTVPPGMEQRKGALLTIEMLFVLPLLLYVGLIIVQSILIHTAHQRVQAAAIAAAELAACGRPHQIVHDEAARVLGYLGGEFQTEYEIIDVNGNGFPDNCVDIACVGVRIPMGIVSVNYLGLLGGSVNKLHIRSVVCKTLQECEGCEGKAACDGLIRRIIADVEALEAAGKINPGNANSLISKLRNALEELCLCNGNNDEACNKLQAFINEVLTFEPGKGKGKDLTADELNALIDAACEAIQCICDRECDRESSQ